MYRSIMILTMSERITLTVPDDLYARIQVVKGKLNMSAVFQKAIEKAVALEEIEMKALSTKEKVIERLRVERQKSEQDWFDCGKSDGLRDAENLSYDDFEQLWDLYESKYELERHNLWIKLNQFPEDFHELLKERMEGYSPKPNKESYLAGWIDGVTDFWDEIKGEI